MRERERELYACTSEYMLSHCTIICSSLCDRERILPSSQYSPLNPLAHMHRPSTQCPCPLQSGTSHSSCLTEHSCPFQPGRQTHWPSRYSPFPEHKTGHFTAKQKHNMIRYAMLKWSDQPILCLVSTVQTLPYIYSQELQP